MKTGYSIALVATLFLVGSEGSAASPKLRIDTSAYAEVRLVVDADFHTRFGLAFPVTYTIGVPQGVPGLTAFTRHDTNAAWYPLPTKISTDFFNDSEVARFDTSEGRAYVSAAFEPESDVLCIQIRDSAGIPLAIAYSGVARYYDNREAAVALSIDDWKAMTDSLFRHATGVLRSFDLKITAAVITADCDESTWQHLQEELDAGSFEAASHTRTHARWPYTGVIPEVQGSRQDILTHLTLPPLYRKGSLEYVYSFLVPFGESSPDIEEVVTRSGYLVSRLVGTSNGEFTAWDPEGYRYNADGTTMELGPPWGSTDLTELDAAFDSTVQNGHIYHLLMHPYSLGATDEWSQPYLVSHLTHISKRTNLWYATLGHLYLYRLLSDTATAQTPPQTVPLTVTLNPVDVAVDRGEAATFEVLAVGDPPLTYQWMGNYVPIAGATEPRYVSPPTTPGDDGLTLQCVISNPTGSVVSGIAMLSVNDSSSRPGENILLNSGFEAGTEGWEFHTETSGDFRTETPGFEGSQEGHIVIGAPATNLQLYQAGFTLEAGARYRLSFQAYSNSGRDLSSIVQQHSSPYTVLGLSYSIFDLTTSWESFSIEFTASGFTETTSDTRLRFWFAPFAQAGDEYHFDNVMLEKLGADERPFIATHPAAQTVAAGQAVVFSVSASGSPPLQYQWQRNLVNIPTATDSVLIIPVVLAADSGTTFRCIVTNPYGTAASAIAMLHVRSVPPMPAGAVRVVVLGSSTAEGEAARPLALAWTNQYRNLLQSINPESQLINLAIGGFTTFNVMPTGYVPPSPWNTSQYSPVPTNNITSALALQPTFIIVNLPTNDCASYIPVSVQLDNFQRVVSEAQAHNVPVWVTSPQPRNIDPAGRSLLFELRDSLAARYAGHLVDFWTDLSDSEGFILPQYNYDDTHLNNAGHAVLYNRIVNVVRWDPPPSIIEDPQSQTRLERDSVLFAVSAEGVGPLAYRWQKNGIEIVGAIDSIYMVPAVTMADSGAAFRAIVSNGGGADTSTAAILRVLPIVPAMITVEPTDTTLFSGQSGRFVVSVSGTAPLQYKWQKNGVDIAEATDSIYILPAVTLADSGSTFRAIVSNVGGADTSTAAILRVLPIVPAMITVEPTDTTLFSGQSGRFVVSASGTAPLQYKWQKNGVDIAEAIDSIYVLPAVVLTDSGSTFRAIVTNVGGTDTSTAAILRVLPLVPASMTASPVDTTLFLGQTARFMVSANGTAPLQYKWQKNGADIGDATDSIYVLPAVVLADSGSTFRAIVSNGGGADTSASALLRVLPVVPAIIAINPADTSAFLGQSVRFVVFANGTAPLAYRWQKNGIDIAEATDSVYRIASVILADSGSAFRAIVSNGGGADTSSIAILRVLPVVSAEISASPVDTTLFLGQAARFAVSASGTAPLQYKWQRNGIDIAEADDSIYILPAATLADSGSTFRAIVSNVGGADTSTAAILRVLPIVAAMITVEPTDTTLFSGQSGRFAVSASGTAPLQYKWQKNKVDIAEATDSIYVLPAVTLADSGAEFRAIVSNGGGADTSTAAILRVAPVVSEGVTVRLKVFLQGPFAGDTMGTALATAGWIPLEQPDSLPSINYAAAESVATIPLNVVDWVLVELRKGEAESTKVSVRAAFLTRDGVVEDLYGTGSVGFPGIDSGAYYVVVRHKNHLSVMSSNPVPLSQTSEVYDFTSGLDKYYGGDAAPLGLGKYGLWGGDADGSGDVAATDRAEVWNGRNHVGYLLSDVDLSGDLSALDRALIWNNRNKATKVP